ncbi:hypothetical protein QQF64_009182 [Cirrhinus molitorella]|uniref:Secreted protein n=1 Tax=Cirrhinus molitorella TaxID=172907 RepID=A0ABR3M0F9_9TELE
MLLLLLLLPEATVNGVVFLLLSLYTSHVIRERPDTSTGDSVGSAVWCCSLTELLIGDERCLAVTPGTHAAVHSEHKTQGCMTLCCVAFQCHFHLRCSGVQSRAQ